jgi:hypothetical protein
MRHIKTGLPSSKYAGFLVLSVAYKYEVRMTRVVHVEKWIGLRSKTLEIRRLQSSDLSQMHRVTGQLIHDMKPPDSWQLISVHHALD